MYEFLGYTRFWRFSEKQMHWLYEEGRIVQESPTSVPRQKRYFDEMPGVPLQPWSELSAMLGCASVACVHRSRDAQRSQQEFLRWPLSSVAKRTCAHRMVVRPKTPAASRICTRRAGS